MQYKLQSLRLRFRLQKAKTIVNCKQAHVLQKTKIIVNEVAVVRKIVADPPLQNAIPSPNNPSNLMRSLRLRFRFKEAKLLEQGS